MTKQTPVGMHSFDRVVHSHIENLTAVMFQNTSVTHLDRLHYKNQTRLSQFI